MAHFDRTGGSKWTRLLNEDYKKLLRDGLENFPEESTEYIGGCEKRYSIGFATLLMALRERPAKKNIYVFHILPLYSSNFLTYLVQS